MNDYMKKHLKREDPKDPIIVEFENTLYDLGCYVESLESTLFEGQLNPELEQEIEDCVTKIGELKEKMNFEDYKKVCYDWAYDYEYDPNLFIKYNIEIPEY